MKHLILFLTFFIASFAAAQSDTTQLESPMTIVEKMPSFPGGDSKMNKFIAKNINYPREAKGVGGTSYLQFIVEKDGSVSNVKVLRGAKGCPACDDEAVKVVLAMPKWEPGEQNGKAVRTLFNLPIKFVP